MIRPSGHWGSSTFASSNCCRQVCGRASSHISMTPRVRSASRPSSPSRSFLRNTDGVGTAGLQGTLNRSDGPICGVVTPSERFECVDDPARNRGPSTSACNISADDHQGPGKVMSDTRWTATSGRDGARQDTSIGAGTTVSVMIQVPTQSSQPGTSRARSPILARACPSVRHRDPRRTRPGSYEAPSG